jgi:hypothetical protein
MHSNSENKDPPVKFTCFINCKNIGMAQYNLIHQFKELGFPEVAFASGTTQALFFGDFLYLDLSTPSNFTVFTFTNKNHMLTTVNKTTLFVTCYKLKVKRSC